MPVQIASVVHTFPDRVETHQKQVCKKHFFKKHCHEEYWTVTYKDQVKLTSFYCMAMPNVTLPDNSGTMFGGLYKNGSVNIFTNKAGCPGNYQQYPLAADTIVCLSEDYELDSQFAVPFNGFFSCQAPDAQKKCADGYSQHLATVENSCEIFYCVRPNVFKSLIPPTIKSPPYLDRDLAQTNVSYSVIQVFINSSMALHIPIMKVVNMIIPKSPNHKFRNPFQKTVLTNDQVVAAVSHFKSNTFAVLNKIAANVR